MFFNLFSFGCTGSSLLHVVFSSCGAQASHAVAPLTVEHRLSSCGARAYLPCRRWDLPGPGIEPVSPALQGGFLTTGPPGKPHSSFHG